MKTPPHMPTYFQTILLVWFIKMTENNRQFRMILKNFCETNYKRQSKIALSTYW